MPDGRAGDEGLFGREARHREDLLTAFEEEWFAGAPPDLAAFVRRSLPPWLPRRGSTVAELIRVDQEFRIKRGERCRVEDYLGRLEYEPEPDELLDLILGEFTLRSRFQMPPTPAEYATRFPRLAGRLRTRLSGWQEPASVAALPSEGETVLRVVAGPHAGMSIRLEPHRPLLVGRADSADVRLDADRGVSRLHLRLESSGGQVRFRDLDSLNGTKLNGRTATEGDLSSGDILRCGETTLTLTIAEDGALERSPPRPDSLVIDDTIPGYDLLELLGRGSLGITYSAVRTATGEAVAVKRIDAADAAPRTVSVIRETAELRPVAGSVLLLPTDIGLAGGHPYLVTPRYRAISFANLTAGRSPSERLPAACRIVERILTALIEPHRIGLAHGGIKASNVLLEGDGEVLRVKLADFGLKRHFTGAPASPDEDLLAAGRLLSKYVHGTSAAPNRSLSKVAERVLQRAVDPDPRVRFWDAAEFARALNHLRR